jgi:hypothetical protein
VVLPTWVIVALPDTTFPPSGWLVALSAVSPHTGAAHGEAAGAACASGASASEIAAARRLRPAFERARPDFPRPPGRFGNRHPGASHLTPNQSVNAVHRRMVIHSLDSLDASPPKLMENPFGWDLYRLISTPS